VSLTDRSSLDLTNLLLFLLLKIDYLVNFCFYCHIVCFHSHVFNNAHPFHLLLKIDYLVNFCFYCHIVCFHSHVFNNAHPFHPFYPSTGKDMSGSKSVCTTSTTLRIGNCK
jgi:hypothetical protein